MENSTNNDTSIDEVAIIKTKPFVDLEEAKKQPYLIRTFVLFPSLKILENLSIYFLMIRCN